MISKNKILTLSAGVAFLSISSYSRSNELKNQPNIIYIMADDMGFADLGCYGSKHIQTPNIDRLAREGVRFLNHYAGTSVCAPSRCSLMTGLTTGHCQVRGNVQLKPYGQIPLKENTVTVASLLKNAGYKTALVGKWGLGAEGTSGDPLKQGFDYYFGYLCQVLAHNHSPEFLMENDKKVYLKNKATWSDSSVFHGMGSYTPEPKELAQELLTQRALKFIEENKKGPFFLYFTPVIPHDNGEAPRGKKYSDILSFDLNGNPLAKSQSDEKVADGKKYSIRPANPYLNKDWTESEKGYASLVTYLDNQVGKIMDKLKSLGLDKNTLVIFTSDNGGDSPDRFRIESNEPYRGIKRDLYEGGIRIPFIARWTGTIQAGRTTNHVSTFWDFLPTACDLANVSIPEITDGISYLPELLGKPQKKHESLYFEFHEQGGKQAVIEGDWKCIKLNVKTPEKTTVELYNIHDDPTEQHNLSSQYPDKVKELLTLMEKSRTENPDFRFIKN